MLQSTIRALAPRGAGVRNPVDLVAAAGADVYGHALEAILGSGEVDALLVIYVSPLVSRPEDIEDAVVRTAGSFATIPTAACFLGGDRPPGPLRGSDADRRPIPAFSYPESAAHALARAAQLAEWRQAPAIAAPVFEDLDIEGARDIVRNWLASDPDGGWVDVGTASRLLACYGVRVVSTRHAGTAEEAAAAAGEVGFPVVLKAGRAISCTRRTSAASGWVSTPARPCGRRSRRCRPHSAIEWVARSSNRWRRPASS